MGKHVTNLGNHALRINNCVISYPHLFKARRAGGPGHETGNPRFSATFILPADLDADDVKLLTDAYEAAIREKFPQGAPAGMRTPWKDPTDADPSLAGRYAIGANAREDSPPGVFTQHGRMRPEEQSQLFAGCIVNLHTRFFGYTKGGNGVSAALNDVQLVDNVNVKRLDNRKDGAEVFGVPGDGFPAVTAPPPNQPAPAVPPGMQQTAPGTVAPGAPPVPMPGQPAPTPPGFLD